MECRPGLAPAAVGGPRVPTTGGAQNHYFHSTFNDLVLSASLACGLAMPTSSCTSRWLPTSL